jgi:predicted transcriptional regulator
MGMTTLSVRLEPDELDQLDAIAEALAERAGGARMTRSKALRIVVDAGLDVLGAQFRQSGSQLKR